MRRTLRLMVIGSLLTLQLGAVAPAATADGIVGQFEIDGNLADDSGSGDPIDWATPPPNLTNITDPKNSNQDNIFGNGSKELEQTSWTCVAQKPPGKDDIVSGQIAFRRLPNGDQYAYTNFFRKDVNGDAHMDFEFNKSSLPVSTSCGSIPQRTSGDILIAFDTENGGATIGVRIFQWNGSTFVEGPTGYADGSVNIPPHLTIPQHTNGDFGEAAVNLTKTIGDVACGEFSGAWMKTRSSTSITAALKDFTRPQPINPDNCPTSSLTKAVRNVTARGNFGTTATASPGDVLEYRLTYSNTGSGSAGNVVVSDTIQPRQTFVSCSQTPACGTNGPPVTTVTWNLGNVAAGTTTTMTFQVRLDASFPAGTTAVKDTATVSTTQEGTKPSNETTTTVTAHPQSGLDKAVRDVTTGTTFGTSTDAAPGDTIEYRLTYTNSGNAPASNVVISDPIPTKTTFVSCSQTPACTTDGPPVTSVTWTVASVAPGTTLIVTFRVRLDSTGFQQGQTVPITNVAQVCTTEEGCKNSPPATVNVKTPNVGLTKAVRNVTAGGNFGTSTTAAPGDVLEYRLTVTNAGTATATNVVVRDLIQAHQTYVSCSQTPACSTDGPPVTRVSWTLTSLAPTGTQTLTFQVRLDSTFPAGTTTVRDTATVVSDQEASKTSNETTATVTAAPVSSLFKAVRDVTSNTSFASSTDAAPGDTIEYRLTYTNTGNASASNVVISDPIPSNTSYLSCSQTPPCSTTGTPVTSVSWTFATVAPGTTIVVTFRVQLAASFPAGTVTPINNTGRVCTTEEGCKNSPPAIVNVKTPKSSLTKAVRNVTTNGTFATTATAVPGNVIEYQLTYTNSGPGTATGVVVSDPIPARSTYLSCTPTCQTDGPPVTTVSWPLSTVSAGGSAIVTFQVRLDATFPAGTTTITNVGSARTDQEAGTTPSNPTTVTVTAAPALTLVKSADKDATAVVVEGNQITYTLRFSNGGNAAATGTTITETVPTGTEFVSCEGGCTVSGSTVTWSLGTVNPGEPGQVTLTVRVTNVVGCTVCNIATISSPDQGGGAAIPSNEVCVHAQPSANPAGAHASGSAVGAAVSGPLASVAPISPTSSSQTGVGTNNGNDETLVPVKVPDDGSQLRADVLATTSTSSVTAAPSQANDLTTAEATYVNVANGLVTADAVYAVASTTATGDSASYSSAGSTFKNLEVQGTPVNDVGPNKTLSLGSVGGLGLGVTVSLREEVGSTSGPAAGQLSGGTYAADLRVTMIHVHIDDADLLTGGKQPQDIIVSQAVAHATFPQTMLCTSKPIRTVSGHAIIAGAVLATDPTTPDNPAFVTLLKGYTVIPAQGGTQDVTLDSVALPDDGSTLTATASQSHSSGTVGATSTSSYDYASAGEVCIKLTSTTACDIYAQAVRSVASSTADANGRSSSPSRGGDATTLVNLVVNGQAFGGTPPPNTTIPIPGVATVVLNEQVCDNGSTLINNCSDGSQSGHTGITVRAIHVILVNGLDGPGGEIVVAEAHSDARYF